MTVSICTKQQQQQTCEYYLTILVTLNQQTITIQNRCKKYTFADAENKMTKQNKSLLNIIKKANPITKTKQKAKMSKNNLIFNTIFFIFYVSKVISKSSGKSTNKSTLLKNPIKSSARSSFASPDETLNSTSLRLSSLTSH